MLRKIIINLIILSLVILPVLALAQGPLVPECGVLSKENKLDRCTFTDFIKFIEKLIDFLIFYLSVPIAVLMLLYAGSLYLFSPIADKKGQAIKIFWAVIWGFVIMLGAWLFIEFIKNAFIDSEFLKTEELAPANI